MYGKSCGMASLAIRQLFPIHCVQIVLIFLRFERLQNFIFECYRPQTWQFYLFFPALFISGIHSARGHVTRSCKGPIVSSTVTSNPSYMYMLNPSLQFKYMVSLRCSITGKKFARLLPKKTWMVSWLVVSLNPREVSILQSKLTVLYCNYCTYTV